MNIPELDNAALMFVGVNEGYTGAAMSLKKPEQASLAVSEVITKERRFIGDNNEYEVMPAIAVYPEDWGCMLGGEPVAAVITNANCAKAIRMARHLQGHFKQEEITLAMFDEQELGKETQNFHALLSSISLQDLGSAWQRVAGNYYAEHGIYVSVGAYEVEHGIVISSQANQDFGVHFDEWTAAAKAVCSAVSEKIGQKILPEFSQVRYIYLNKQDLNEYLANNRNH